MITNSIYGLCLVLLFCISVLLIFTAIMCIIHKIKHKPIFSDKLLYVAFTEGLVSLCFLKWYFAVPVWGALLICNICYVRYVSDRKRSRSQDNKIDSSLRVPWKEVTSQTWFKVQVSTLAFINLQFVFEDIPCLQVQALCGNPVLDYILNFIGITGALIVAYFLLKPLFLHGRPSYSGWERDYVVYFLLGSVLVHVLFAMLYFLT